MKDFVNTFKREAFILPVMDITDFSEIKCVINDLGHSTNFLGHL